MREWEVVRVFDEIGAQVYPYANLNYSVDFSLEFLKNGDFTETFSYSYGSYSYSYGYKGTWEFSSNKENLIISLDNNVEKWKITRLTKKELQFTDADDYEWELEAK